MKNTAWETIRDTPAGDPQVKRLDVTPSVRLTLERIDYRREYALDIDLRTKRSNVRRTLTLIPADGPDTWDYMQDVAEGAARLWLEEITDLASAASTALNP